jgi:Rab proteins geranylgeranyltransferase component A
MGDTVNISAGVIYASVAGTHDESFQILDRAVSALLNSIDEQPKPHVLWKMQYQQRAYSPAGNPYNAEAGILELPTLTDGIVLHDHVLDAVKEVWRKITGEAEENFMKFEARDGIVDDDE